MTAKPKKTKAVGSHGRAGGPSFAFLRSAPLWVPHSCALRKGGYHGHISLQRILEPLFSFRITRRGYGKPSPRFWEHRARPCKKRKDGAPTLLALWAKSKACEPPPTRQGWRKPFLKISLKSVGQLPKSARMGHPPR